MNILAIAARNLRRRTTRTLIALAGVAVGVSMVISIISSAGGLRTQFYRMATEFRGDLIVTQKHAFVPMQSRIDGATTERLGAYPGIASTSLMRIWRQPLKNQAGSEQPVMVLGMRPTDLSLRRYPISAGRPLQNGDRAVIVGELLARDLGFALGDQVEVLGQTLPIVGLFRSPIAKVPFLSGGVLCPLAMMSTTIAPDEPITGNMAVLHVDERATGPRSGANEASLLALDARVKEVGAELLERERTFKAQAFSEYLDSFRSQLVVIDQFAWAISILAVLAGGIGIMNTMIMSVFERTREIGLLMAIGWPRGRIMATIVAEGGLLAILGGLLGIPLGLLEVKLATFLIKLGWIEVTLDPTLFLEALGLATVVGLLGSLYPAWNAASFTPTEALRYE